MKQLQVGHNLQCLEGSDMQQLSRGDKDSLLNSIQINMKRGLVVATSGVHHQGRQKSESISVLFFLSLAIPQRSVSLLVL